MSDFVLSVFSGLCPGFSPWVQPFLLLGGKHLTGGGKLLEKPLNLPLGIEAFATIDIMDAYIWLFLRGEVRDERKFEKLPFVRQALYRTAEAEALHGLLREAA